MARRAQHDAAVSDIVGTSVVLAVTVLAVGAAAVGFSTMGSSHTVSPELDLLANATASSDAFITLKHAGGASLDLGDLQYVVSSSSWSGGPVRGALGAADPSAPFALGSAAFITNTGHALASGDAVDVLLYLGEAGTLVTQTSFIVAAAPSSSPPVLDTFLVDLTAPTQGTGVPAGGTVLVSAKVEHPDGRKAIERVFIDLTPVNGSSEYQLHDDGTLGDAVASDGAYSAFVAIPPLAMEGPHTLRLRAMDLDGYRNNESGSDALLSISILPSELSQIQGILNGINGTNGGAGATGGTGATGGAGGTGAQGIPGLNGSGGGNLTNLTGPVGPPGATGSTGPNGTTGSTGSTGSTGATGANGTAGTNGTNGTSYVAPLAGIPDITSMAPIWGPAGTLVYLTGFELTNVSSVTMGVQGASTAYSASFAPDPGSAAGEGIVFLVPSIPDGAYVVTVTTLGGWATAPTYFSVLSPQPEIDSIDPPSARSYRQINITGANFSAVASVTLYNPSVGDVAVPWAVIDDSHLGFVTHPGLAPGIYDVNVSTGLKWAIAPLAFQSLTPLAPAGVHLTPTSAMAEQVVTITGTNLETVSRVTLNLTNQTRIIDAGWYLDGTDLKVAVPVAAAPAGHWNLVYHVELTGSFLGVVSTPEDLTVIPTPGPTLASFTPVRGEPFTQVNLFGTNFVNVKSVTFGQTAVYFAVVSTTQILGVTHAGLAPGNYTINVTTATGSAENGLFEALPLKIVPVYNKTLISSFATNITVSQELNNAHITNVTVKARAAPGYTITGINIVPVNYGWLTGSAPVQPLGQGSGATKLPFCTSGNITAWSGGSMQNEWGLQKYAPSYNEFDFYFEVTLTKDGTTYKTFVQTNAQNQNFILPARIFTMSVLDQGFPTSFSNCGV